MAQVVGPEFKPQYWKQNKTTTKPPTILEVGGRRL
jgi:hypothetical protein